MRRTRFYIEWALVFVVSLVCAALLAKSTLGNRIDNFLLDQLVITTRDEPDDRILLVAVDEASLARIGPWPWDRNIHAKLINQLAESGATTVGIDILFTEAGDPAADAALADAIAGAGNVIIPNYLNGPGADDQYFAVSDPIPAIARASKAVGHVNVRFDSDALVRRAHLRLNGETKIIDHFALEIARHSHASTLSSVATIVPRRLPDASPDIIPFHVAGSYSTISAEAVLAGELPPGLLKGKTILVGATAPGLGDSFAVPGPAGHVMAGIEIQANMIDALINGRMLREADGGLPLPVIGLFVALLLLAYWHLSPTASLAATMTLMLATLIAIFAAFYTFGLWYPPSGLLLALLLVYPLWSWRRLTALDSYIQGEAAALQSSLKAVSDQPARSGMDRISASIDNLRSLVGRVQDVRGFMERTIEKAPDAMIVVDDQGRVLLANPEADRLFALPVAGAILADLLPCCNTDWRRIDTEIALQPDCILLARGAPLGHSAEPQGPGIPSAIVRLIDISKMRQLESQRSEMLEFLSHDMRAPQAAILTLVAAAPTAHSDPLLARIRRQAETGLKLADDFVQLARLDTAAPQKALVDLRDILGEVVDRCYPAAMARGIALQRPAEDEPALIDADPWLLDRAFGNLLDNAIKFSPAGAAVQCSIDAVQGGAAYMACIADKGPGLPEERIEEPFERFGSRAADGAGGAGLGLAFVKKVADAHSASIAVETGADGTKMMLTFASAEISDPE